MMLAAQLRQSPCVARHVRIAERELHLVRPGEGVGETIAQTGERGHGAGSNGGGNGRTTSATI
jgi:hypothetical protein